MIPQFHLRDQLVVMILIIHVQSGKIVVNIVVMVLVATMIKFVRMENVIIRVKIYGDEVIKIKNNFMLYF